MNFGESLKKSSREMIVKRACKLLEKNPEKNVDKLFTIMKALSKDKRK